MKKLIFLLAITSFISLSTKADDPVRFKNNFNCGIMLWMNCWDCNAPISSSKPTIANQVHIPANSSVYLVPTQDCEPGHIRTYQVCYDIPSGCDATCSNYAMPNITPFTCTPSNVPIGNSMIIAPCEGCNGNLTMEVFFDIVNGDFIMDTREY